MIPLSTALSLVLKHSSQPLPIISHKVDHTLSGHVLAEDVFAETDIPRTRTTNVDGYAVVSGTTKVGIYNVVKANDIGDGVGKVVRVNTGGPLPEGTDAVVMVEDTELRKSTFTAQPHASAKEHRTGG
jgi:gephyrin